MQTAYSYLRFSSPQQVNTQKLNSQIEKAREYAENNDLFLDENLTFQDLGVSAFTGRNRTVGKLGEFLFAVKNGLVKPGSYLLIESLDRLSRESARKALRTLEDICDEGIAIVTLIDNKKYTSEILDHDPTALLFSIVIFMRANEESLTKSRRAIASWERKLGRARKGEKRLMTKMVPGWLKVDGEKLIIDKKKVKIIQKMFNFASMGLGPLTIASNLNVLNVPNFNNGKAWKRGHVHYLLNHKAVLGVHQPYRSIRVSGLKARMKEDPIPNYFPQIISKQIWNKARKFQKIRTSEHLKNTQGKACPIKNIFAYIATCPICGDRMSRRMRASLLVDAEKLTTLICRSSEGGGGCHNVPVPYEPLEIIFFEEAEGLFRDRIKYVLGIEKNHPSKQTQSYEVEEVRLNIALDLLRKTPLDKTAFNSNIRFIFSKIIINYPEGTLDLLWCDGKKSVIPFEERTKEILSKIFLNKDFNLFEGYKKQLSKKKALKENEKSSKF